MGPINDRTVSTKAVQTTNETSLNNKPPSIYKEYIKPDGQLMHLFAHRGASAECSENTIFAIVRAYENGAHGYEIDIQGTQGKAIVLHDPTLKRTAVSGSEWMPEVTEAERTPENLQRILETPVYKLSFEDTQKINVGTQDHPEPPPALSDVLEFTTPKGFFGLHEVKVNNSDAKQNTLRGYRDSILETSRKTDMSPTEIVTTFNLISFDDGYLEDQKKFMPEFDISIYWIREFNYDANNPLDDPKYLYKPSDLTRAESIGAHFDVECCEEAKRLIPQIQARGFTVGAWVRGEDTEKKLPGTDGDHFANMLKELGCEFMTTDLPDDMKK